MREPQGAPNRTGYDRWCRATDGPLLLLALAFLVVFLAPLYRPDLPPVVRRTCTALNVAIWAAFGLDYLVRLLLSPSRRAFVRGHVPDLLTLAVPVLRPLRLLRVVGMLGAASRRAGSRRLLATSSYGVGAVAVLLVVAAGLVLDAERGAEGANILDVDDALWWASTTVTTVGYGDRFPVTGEGRLIAVLLMIGGIALLGVVTASVATWFVRRFSQLDELEEAVSAESDASAAALAEISARLERIEAALLPRP